MIKTRLTAPGFGPLRFSPTRWLELSIVPKGEKAGLRSLGAINSVLHSSQGNGSMLILPSDQLPPDITSVFENASRSAAEYLQRPELNLDFRQDLQAFSPYVGLCSHITCRSDSGEPVPQTGFAFQRFLTDDPLTAAFAPYAQDGPQRVFGNFLREINGNAAFVSISDGTQPLPTIPLSAFMAHEVGALKLLSAWEGSGMPKGGFSDRAQSFFSCGYAFLFVKYLMLHHQTYGLPPSPNILEDTMALTSILHQCLDKLHQLYPLIHPDERGLFRLGYPDSSEYVGKFQYLAFLDVVDS